MGGPSVRVAFLRGMNLGRRRLTNEELVAAFGRLGHPDARAYQASGNVVFRGNRPEEEQELEAGLERELGYAVPVFLRSGDQVRSLADREPFPEAAVAAVRGRPQVVFLRRTPRGQTIDRILELVPGRDRLVPAGRELFWLPADGVGRTEMDLRRLDELTGGTTIRTHATIRRLAARFLEG